MTEQPPEVTRTPIEGLGYWVRRRQPALFPGAIPPDVCAMWSPDVIRRAGGDVVVRVEKSDVGTQVPALGGSWGRFDRVHQSLGSVVDALDAQGPPYLYASSLRVRQILPDRASVLPNLDVPLPGEPEPILFLGQRATGSHWHYDASFNFLLVLHGVKVVVLRPPSAFRAMAPSRFWSFLPHFSGVPEVEDGCAFPTERTASLGPGDGLFIPPGWWHKVVNESPSVSVTYTYPLSGHDFLRWRFLRLWVSHRLLHPLG